MKKYFTLGGLFSLILLLSLTGCGGGGGGGSDPGISGGAGSGNLAIAPSPEDDNQPPAAANQPPSLATIGDKTIGEGEMLSFVVGATDPDAANTLTFSVSNLPLGASFDPATKTFTWTPEFDQAGVYPNVLFQVTDNGTPPLSDTESITITVGDVNRPPVLAPIGDKQVNEGQTLTFTLSATDPDGNIATYQMGNGPQGSSFDPCTGVFTWTPSFGQAGAYADIRFTATDDGSPPQSDTESITITVGDVNRPPVLSPIGDKTMSEGVPLEFAVTATDPDGDALVFSAANLPTGASFDPATQKFSWTPTYEQAAGGPYSVIFTVQDTGSPMELDLETIMITALNVNRPPQFTPIGTQQVAAGSLLAFIVTATDPDGNEITYTTGTLPAGASFDPATQVFAWTPGAEGYWLVTFYATDNGSPTMQAQLDVFITVGNLPTPGALIDQIIAEVLALHLPKAIENSYLANLKDAKKFFEDNKTTYAQNQLEAFINKVNVDVSYGLIDATEGARLTSWATAVLNLLPSV